MPTSGRRTVSGRVDRGSPAGSAAGDGTDPGRIEPPTEASPPGVEPSRGELYFVNQFSHVLCSRGPEYSLVTPLSIPHSVVDVRQIDVQHPGEAEPIWQLQPLRKKEEATSL